MEVKNIKAINYISRPVDHIGYPHKNEQKLQLNKELEEELSANDLENKINLFNEVLESINTAIKFQIHEESESYYIQVIDLSTNEILREIPPKKFLDFYVAMADFMGLFVDERL